MANPPQGEILIEYKRIGNIMRVSAVDAETGTEVTFQAPANAHPSDLQRLAVNKLKYVMQKKG